MPTIEDVDDDFSDPDDVPLDVASAPPAAKAGFTPPPMSAFMQGNYQGGIKTVAPEMCKEWATIYPIYLDAKRPYKKGNRRVGKSSALQWPLAEHIASACVRLGFEAVYEPEKTHPKDWENPGRVKVLIKKDGFPTNKGFKDKGTLLAAIGKGLAQYQPKAPAPTESNPNPLPPIHLRLPPHSPAISHGVLESAMKGGGPMGGLLGNMLGGGGEEEKEEEEPKKKEVPKVQKLKPIRMKGKRR